jgi:hypothetical protein
MAGKALKFIKWFAFAFLFFSFVKSLIPADTDLRVPTGVLSIVSALFSLDWIVQFQVIICFGIAFYGIVLLTRIVLEQMASERRKNDEKLRSKRIASLAGLPYALRLARGYVKTCSKVLLDLHDRCQKDVLQKKSPVPAVPRIDPMVLETLKDCIDIFPENTAFLSTLMASLKIQNSQLHELAERHVDPRAVVQKQHIEAQLREIAEISAQLELLAEFTRKEGKRLPRKIRNRDIGHALIALISDDRITIPLIDKYQLSSDEIWVPAYLKV